MQPRNFPVALEGAAARRSRRAGQGSGSERCCRPDALSPGREPPAPRAASARAGTEPRGSRTEPRGATAPPLGSRECRPHTNHALPDQWNPGARSNRRGQRALNWFCFQPINSQISGFTPPPVNTRCRLFLRAELSSRTPRRALFGSRWGCVPAPASLPLAAGQWDALFGGRGAAALSAGPARRGPAPGPGRARRNRNRRGANPARARRGPEPGRA